MAEPTNKHLVSIVFRNPSKAGIEQILKKFPTFFRTEGDDLIFRSWLDDHCTADEHLKWFFGMIQFDGKFFRQMEASGCPAVVIIRTHTRPLCIEPEALLLSHKLHLAMEIHVTK